MRSQAASRSAPSSDSGRTRISLPSVSTQTLSGFRAMLRNHAGCAADPPAVPVTIQLVADSPSGKRPSKTWRRSPERAPTVVTNSKGRPSTRMAVPFLRYWRTIQPAPRRIPTRMKRGKPVPRVPFGVTRMLTAGGYSKGREATEDAFPEAGGARSRPVARDSPPANGFDWDGAERTRIRARLGGVAAQIDGSRFGVHGRDALDELARRVARIGGQDDLSHTWRPSRVGTTLDDEPHPRKQGRGHRVALDFDHIEPASREGDGGDAGAQRQATDHKRREGPVAAPLRGHRS